MYKWSLLPYCLSFWETSQETLNVNSIEGALNQPGVKAPHPQVHGCTWVYFLEAKFVLHLQPASGQLWKIISFLVPHFSLSQRVPGFLRPCSVRAGSVGDFVPRPLFKAPSGPCYLWCLFAWIFLVSCCHAGTFMFLKKTLSGLLPSAPPTLLRPMLGQEISCLRQECEGPCEMRRFCPEFFHFFQLTRLGLHLLSSHPLPTSRKNIDSLFFPWICPPAWEEEEGSSQASSFLSDSSSGLGGGETG